MTLITFQPKGRVWDKQEPIDSVLAHPYDAIIQGFNAVYRRRRVKEFAFLIQRPIRYAMKILDMERPMTLAEIQNAYAGLSKSKEDREAFAGTVFSYLTTPTFRFQFKAVAQAFMQAAG